MHLRSKKRRPVNDRVALFVWVPGRIGVAGHELTGPAIAKAMECWSEKRSNFIKTHQLAANQTTTRRM
jgi:hypothetical protein